MREATMPMTPGCQPSDGEHQRGIAPPVRRVGHQALGLEHGRGLDRLALGVDRVELARDLERALAVVGQQQLEPASAW